jgi:hypothetical protein
VWVPVQAGDQLVDLGLRRDAAGRVGGAVHDQQARRRRDLRQHLVGVEREPVLLAQPHRHTLGTGVADDRLVDRESRVRVDDLRPWLAEHQDGEEHRHLAAGHDQDVRGIDCDLAAQQDVRRHRLAQGRDAVRRRVAVMAVAQRLHRRLDDVLGRLEVRLADAEIDDVFAFGRQRRGSGQDLESGLRAQAGQVFGEAQVGHEGFSLIVFWPLYAG